MPTGGHRQACGKKFRLCEIMARFRHPASSGDADKSSVSYLFFQDQGNFGAVTKPQRNLFKTGASGRSSTDCGGGDHAFPPILCHRSSRRRVRPLPKGLIWGHCRVKSLPRQGQLRRGIAQPRGPPSLPSVGQTILGGRDRIISCERLDVLWPTAMPPPPSPRRLRPSCQIQIDCVYIWPPDIQQWPFRPSVRPTAKRCSLTAARRPIPFFLPSCSMR